MSQYSNLLQGRFTSNGAAKTIVLPGGVDFMEVVNLTEQAAANGDRGVSYLWQNGYASNNGSVTLRNAAATAVNVSTSAALGVGGFTYVDSSINVPEAANALTAITAANPPVVTTAATLPSVGDIVRVYGLDNQPQVSGLDFSVTAAGGGTFTIGNINLANSTASTAGFWRKIPYPPMFYPSKRYVTYIRAAAQAVIYMSVTHDLTIGQKVRLNFPGGSAVWGNYAALDGVQAAIVGINVARAGNEPNNGGTANNIVVNVDTSAFGNWNVFGAAGNQAYPPATAVPFTPALVIPIGEEANNSIIDVNGNPLNSNLLDDAMRNTSIVGMRLAAGITSPAGSNGDVIYWRAWSAYNVDNQ